MTFGGGNAVYYTDCLINAPWRAGKKIALMFYLCAVHLKGRLSWSKEENLNLPLKIEILADTTRPADDQLGWWEEIV